MHIHTHTHIYVYIYISIIDQDIHTFRFLKDHFFQGSGSALAQALVTATADPLGKGPKGVTALHRAAMEGHEEVTGAPVATGGHMGMVKITMLLMGKWVNGGQNHGNIKHKFMSSLIFHSLIFCLNQPSPCY